MSGFPELFVTARSVSNDFETGDGGTVLAGVAWVAFPDAEPLVEAGLVFNAGMAESERQQRYRYWQLERNVSERAKPARRINMVLICIVVTVATWIALARETAYVAPGEIRIQLWHQASPRPDDIPRIVPGSRPLRRPLRLFFVPCASDLDIS